MKTYNEKQKNFSNRKKKKKNKRKKKIILRNEKRYHNSCELEMNKIMFIETLA